MKFAIVLAVICFLGVAFAAPAPDAAAKPNAFADWQKAFQETLNNLLGNKDKPKREAAAAPEKKLSTNVFADAGIAMQNAFKQAMDNAFKQQNNAAAAKRSLTWADLDGLKEVKGYKGKRDLTGDILTAVMNMNNPIVLAQTMFKIMNQLNAMGQNKTADASAPAAPAAGNLAGEAIALLTKTNDPMAFAGSLFKIVNTLAKDNKVVLPAGAAKPKFNFLQNPTLKNPNWNKKPATEAEAVEEAVEEVVEEVVEESTEAAVERVARQESLPEWEPSFKDQMKANAYGIIGVGNLLEYLDERKAKKAAAAAKSKRELFKKTPTGWVKASELEAAEEVVEDSTEATRVAREAEAAPAPAAGQFSLKDFGKMVDDFYAQFQAPKKSA